MTSNPGYSRQRKKPRSTKAKEKKIEKDGIPAEEDVNQEQNQAADGTKAKSKGTKWTLILAR